MPTLAFFAALALAAVHVFAARLTALRGSPRSAGLSAAGGITVAYVFLFLLPHLAEGQQQIARANPGINFLEHHVYVLALSGLIFFYGLERAAKISSARHANAGEAARSRLFWAHIVSFFFYNLLIGYLLIEEGQTLFSLGLFFIAIALHFITIDFSFREHYPTIYHRSGRWILAVAVIAGWLIGVVFDLPSHLVSLLTAFLSGGIILNILKEELPAERQSRFIPFLLGGASYAVLLLCRP